MANSRNANSAGWQTGCGCAILLCLVGAVGLFAAVVIFTDPDPVWGDRQTVVVKPTPSPTTSDDESTDRDGRGSADNPSEVIRKRVESLLRHRVIAMIGESPDNVRCGVAVPLGGGDLGCVVEYQGLKANFTVKISNVDVSGLQVSWDHEGATTDAVILTQQGINRLFLKHLPTIGVKAEEIEIRCDRIPRSVLVKVRELDNYNCYTREDSGEAGKAFPLKYAQVAGLIFGASER